MTVPSGPFAALPVVCNAQLGAATATPWSSADAGTDVPFTFASFLESELFGPAAGSEPHLTAADREEAGETEIADCPGAVPVQAQLPPDRLPLTLVSSGPAAEATDASAQPGAVRKGGAASRQAPTVPEGAALSKDANAGRAAPPVAFMGVISTAAAVQSCGTGGGSVPQHRRPTEAGVPDTSASGNQPQIGVGADPGSGAEQRATATPLPAAPSLSFASIAPYSFRPVATPASAGSSELQSALPGASLLSAPTLNDEAATPEAAAAGWCTPPDGPEQANYSTARATARPPSVEQVCAGSEAGRLADLPANALRTDRAPDPAGSLPPASAAPVCRQETQEQQRGFGRSGREGQRDPARGGAPAETAPGDSRTEAGFSQLHPEHVPAPVRPQIGVAGAPGPVPPKTAPGLKAADAADETAPRQEPRVTQFSISVDAAGRTGDSRPRIHLRVAERAGEVNVVVRAHDPQVRASLQSDLGSLAERLDQAGYRAELRAPGDNPAAAKHTEPRADAAADGANSGERSGNRERHAGGSAHHHRRRRQQEIPQTLVFGRKTSDHRSIFDDLIR